MPSTPLFLPVLALFIGLAVAAIPSNGQQTVLSVRSILPDRAFLIRNDRHPDTVSSDGRYLVYNTNPVRNPALAAPDTQVQVNTVHLKGGRRFTKHYHPRATETVILHKGRLVSQLWFEGSKPRKVQITLRPRDSTVYPLGLVHLVRCVGRETCVFTAVFNSADPGAVLV